MDDDVRQLLEAPNFAHVSTLRHDGSVHAVLTWVDVDGDEVVLNSADGRDWVANVRRDPRITVVVPDKDNPYKYVAIRGRVAREEGHDTAWPHINAMAKKYLGKNEYPFAQPGEQRVKLHISPEDAKGFGG